MRTGPNRIRTRTLYRGYVVTYRRLARNVINMRKMEVRCILTFALQIFGQQQLRERDEGIANIILLFSACNK